MHSLAVSPVERSLIRKMEVPEPISPRERAKLKYFVGYDESKGIGDAIVPSSASRICKFHMQSRSTTYIGIESSIRVEDDVILRYVPYFGDNESGKEIDVKQYEKIRHEEACDRSCLDDEASEHFLRLVVAECGTSPTVFRALKNVCGYNQAFSEYGEIKKDHDAKRLAAQEIDAAKAMMNAPVSAPADSATHAQMVALFKQAPTLDFTDVATKPLVERLAPPPTFFASNFARRDADARVRKLGLRSAGAYADLSEHYRDLFCRMCYTYDCQKHGIEHPQPRERTDPINPPLRLSPVALASMNETDSAKPLESANAESADTPVANDSPTTAESEDGDHGTDAGDEPTSSALLLEKRRSARPQTRVSTLASTLLDGLPVVEKSRGHRPPRVPPVRKTADGSEFLDELHCAMVEAKVSAFARKSDACSASCWKRSVPSACDGESKLEADAVAAADACGGESALDDDVSENFKRSLCATELALLQKTRDAVGDNPCTIASIVPSILCKDLHLFLESERKRAPQPLASVVDVAAPLDARGSKKGRGHGSRGSKTDAAKRNRNLRQREKGTNHEFEPCNHDGKCGSDDCSCISRDHMCEKACSCSRDCPNRFVDCVVVRVLLSCVSEWTAVANA